jgi:hypothetical protein
VSDQIAKALAQALGSLELAMDALKSARKQVRKASDDAVQAALDDCVHAQHLAAEAAAAIGEMQGRKVDAPVLIDWAAARDQP